jgi:hypothetical protein
MLYLLDSTHSQATTPLREQQFHTNFVLILCRELNKCMLTNLTLIGRIHKKATTPSLKQGSWTFFLFFLFC